MSNLPISRLVNVAVNLSPLAAQAQNISTLLALTSTDVIDTLERIRTYSTIDEVAADFGTSGIEYNCALLWFQQAPQPTLLKFGRWAKTSTAGKLLGAPLSAAAQSLALFTPVTSPSFFVYLDGVPCAIAPASFATVTNLNGVASIIQTALQVKLANTTCVWNSNYSRFEIESGTTGASSSVSFLTAPTATGKITFSANPANTDTITLNGTAITFVTGTPSGSQVQIGASLSATLASLLTFLQASADTQLVKFTYLLNAAKTILYTTAAAAGTGGNALTIAASVATPSGGTLAGGSGTDISDLIGGRSTDSGSYVVAGVVAETALQAAALFDDQFGQTWYALTMPEASDSEHQLVAPFIEATNNKHLYGVSTQEGGVLSAVSTTDIAYLLKALGLTKTLVQYSSTSAYSVCSLLGRALTVDYNGNSTVITLMYKQEPGIVAENLTTSQVNALEGKNCNVFVAYNNNTAIIEPGKVCSGDFIDTITGTDWLALEVQNQVYNLLYTTNTKIPQTDSGTHLIVTTIEHVCSQAVSNGLLAPGVWDANGFGGLSEGDFLPKGFYVYAPPISSQSQADRAARKSVPIQVAAKLAGAVHTVNVQITVAR